MNVQKSSILFSKKFQRKSSKREIGNMLSMKQSHSHDIYLGIPMNVTKTNKEALEAVIERIKDGCKMEVMSQAACTCVIKYVATATALPQHQMPSRNFL